MKKSLLVLAMVLILGGTAMADFSQHPKHGQITSFTASMIGTIKGLQNSFFVRNGYYFQGLPLLGDVLPDGTTDLPAQYTRKPSDQTNTWQDFGPAVFKPGLTIPVNVRINVYQSPDGWGYRVILEFFYEGLGPDAYGNNGNHWMYVHSEGVESSWMPEDEWFILHEEVE